MPPQQCPRLTSLVSLALSIGLKCPGPDDTISHLYIHPQGSSPEDGNQSREPATSWRERLGTRIRGIELCVCIEGNMLRDLCHRCHLMSIGGPEEDRHLHRCLV